MKNITILTLVFISVNFAFSQPHYSEELLKWKIGQKFGPLFYHGDIKTGTGFSNEADFERVFSEKFSLVGSMMFGFTQGRDKNIITSTGKTAGLNFQVIVLDFLISGKYYLLHKNRLHPFLQFGFGSIFYWTRIDGNADGFYESPVGWDGNPNDKKGSAFYRDGTPIGAIETQLGFGLDLTLNDNFDFIISYSFKFTSTDHIDAIASNSGSFPNSYIYATNPSEYSINEFKELIQHRQTQSKKSGDDSLSLINFGFAYKFVNYTQTSPINNSIE